jgi:hypothetical protein
MQKTNILYPGNLSSNRKHAEYKKGLLSNYYTNLRIIYKYQYIQRRFRSCLNSLLFMEIEDFYRIYFR